MKTVEHQIKLPNLRTLYSQFFRFTIKCAKKPCELKHSCEESDTETNFMEKQFSDDFLTSVK